MQQHAIQKCKGSASAGFICARARIGRRGAHLLPRAREKGVGRNDGSACRAARPERRHPQRLCGRSNAAEAVSRLSPRTVHTAPHCAQESVKKHIPFPALCIGRKAQAEKGIFIIRKARLQPQKKRDGTCDFYGNRQRHVCRLPCSGEDGKMCFNYGESRHKEIKIGEEESFYVRTAFGQW